MNGSNYMVFTSVDTFADFDRVMADGNTIMAGMSEREGAAIAKAFTEDVQNVVTNRYRLNPRMTYPSPDWRAADPVSGTPTAEPTAPGALGRQGPRCADAPSATLERRTGRTTMNQLIWYPPAGRRSVSPGSSGT